MFIRGKIFESIRITAPKTKSFRMIFAYRFFAFIANFRCISFLTAAKKSAACNAALLTGRDIAQTQNNNSENLKMIQS